MIIRVNTSQESELGPLFKYLNAEGMNYRFLSAEKVVVAPKLADDTAIRKFNTVTEIIAIDTPYQLASNLWKKQTSFEVNGVPVGSGLFNIIAGPCSVESEEQIF